MGFPCPRFFRRCSLPSRSRRGQLVFPPFPEGHRALFPVSLLPTSTAEVSLSDCCPARRAPRPHHAADVACGGALPHGRCSGTVLRHRGTPRQHSGRRQLAVAQPDAAALRKAMRRRWLHGCFPGICPRRHRHGEPGIARRCPCRTAVLSGPAQSDNGRQTGSSLSHESWQTRPGGHAMSCIVVQGRLFPTLPDARCGKLAVKGEASCHPPAPFVAGLLGGAFTVKAGEAKALEDLVVKAIE